MRLRGSFDLYDAQKNCLPCVWPHTLGLVRSHATQVRDVSCGSFRMYLEFEVRRVLCRRGTAVKRERGEFLGDNPFCAHRVADAVETRRLWMSPANCALTGTASRRLTRRTCALNWPALAPPVPKRSASTRYRSAADIPTASW